MTDNSSSSSSSSTSTAPSALWVPLESSGNPNRSKEALKEVAPPQIMMCETQIPYLILISIGIIVLEAILLLYWLYGQYRMERVLLTATSNQAAAATTTSNNQSGGVAIPSLSSYKDETALVSS